MFKNKKGFTLIEMLIVLMIITVLIILLIPNLTDKSTQIHDRGCEALVSTVQSQVHAYQLDEGKLPDTLTVLTDKDYITKEQLTCKNKEKIKYNDSTGLVTSEAN